MKFIESCFVFPVALVLSLNSCQSDKNKGQVVKEHCGSCHLVPEPGLLDKRNWEQGVLPEMALRMGLKLPDFSLVIPSVDSTAVYGSLPASPMVTEDEWESIRNYYLELAPDSLPANG